MTVANAVAAAAATRGRSGGALAFLRAVVPSSRRRRDDADATGETGETGETGGEKGPSGATTETSRGGDAAATATRHFLLARGDFVGVRDALLRAVETASGDGDDDAPRGIASAVGHARVGHATHATRLHAILPWLAARRGAVDGLGELRAVADDAAAAAAAAAADASTRRRDRGE
jgi:hypothetical protein